MVSASFGGACRTRASQRSPGPRAPWKKEAEGAAAVTSAQSDAQLDMVRSDQPEARNRSESGHRSIAAASLGSLDMMQTAFSAKLSTGVLAKN